MRESVVPLECQAPAVPRSAATQPGLAPAGPRCEPPWFTEVIPRGSTEPRWFDGSRPRPEPPRLSRTNPPAEGRSTSPRCGQAIGPSLGVNHGGSTGIAPRGSAEPRWFAWSKPRPDPPRLGRASHPAVPCANRGGSTMPHTVARRGVMARVGPNRGGSPDRNPTPIRSDSTGSTRPPRECRDHPVAASPLGRSSGRTAVVRRGIGDR